MTNDKNLWVYTAVSKIDFRLYGQGRGTTMVGL